MYFLFKMGIFHCYVCLPEGNIIYQKLPLQLPSTLRDPDQRSTSRWVDRVAICQCPSVASQCVDELCVFFCVLFGGVEGGQGIGKLLKKKMVGIWWVNMFFWGLVEVKSGEQKVGLGGSFFSGRLGGCSDQSTGVSFSCSWRQSLVFVCLQIQLLSETSEKLNLTKSKKTI